VVNMELFLWMSTNFNLILKEVGYLIKCVNCQKNFFSIFYISIKRGVQMFDCLLVCGGLMEIQTPGPILMKFSTHIPSCPRKVLVQV